MLIQNLCSSVPNSATIFKFKISWNSDKNFLNQISGKIYYHSLQSLLKVSLKNLTPISRKIWIVTELGKPL
jgi:hypothetical protein